LSKGRPADRPTGRAQGFRAIQQTFPQSTLPSQPALDPRHRPSIALVIVSEQVQQAMQRQHSKLGRLVVAHGVRLPADGNVRGRALPPGDDQHTVKCYLHGPAVEPEVAAPQPVERA